jgi:hypothetical protein
MKGARIRSAGPGFFETMGVKLVAGRLLSETDRADTEHVAVVNRAFVRAFFPDGGPLNHTITYGYPGIDPRTASRIIGVVADVRYRSLAEDSEPACYLATAQLPFPPVRQMVVVAPRTGDPDAVVPPIRDAMRRFDPQAVVSFEPATAIVTLTLERQELGMTLMLIFGATALALGAIGIYGVVAYAGGQRSVEIATRMALGASRWDVFSLMIGSSLRFGVAGLLAGLGIAYGAGRVVASSVFAMRASDPLVLAIAFLAVAAVTLVATAIPAIRACGLDPHGRAAIAVAIVVRPATLRLTAGLLGPGAQEERRLLHPQKNPGAACRPRFSPEHVSQGGNICSAELVSAHP